MEMKLISNKLQNPYKQFNRIVAQLDAILSM